MAGFGRLLGRFEASISDRRGVSAAEYAILAVGMVVAVAAAVIAYDSGNPIRLAGSALTSVQTSLVNGP